MRLRKRRFLNLLDASYPPISGLRETVIFADKLMNFGFTFATRAGAFLFVLDDMLVPVQIASGYYWSF